MKRTIIILVIFAALTTCIYPANAGTDSYSPARDAMIAYTGTDAFTKLTSMERQACVDWLVHGGEMSEKCSKAVMKLVSYAPNAVSAEQRQALIAEASGNNTVSQPEPQPTTEEQPQIVKKNDDTGKIIAVGLLGVLAGLIIHNNVGHHKSTPSYTPPEPPRHEPPHRNNPPQPQHLNRPVQRQPQPRPVNRQPDRRPPHR